jgi:hypothetical protein
LEAIVRRAPHFVFFADAATAKRVDYRSWSTPTDRFHCDELIDLGCRLFAKYYDVLLPNEITAAVPDRLLPPVAAIVAAYCLPM